MLSERDVLMYEGLSQRGVKTREQRIHRLLVLGSEKKDSKEGEFKELLILDDTVEDFSSEPIISIGGEEIEYEGDKIVSIRERIILNPASPILKAAFTDLCGEIKKAQNERKSAYKDDLEAQQLVLDTTVTYMGKRFPDELATEEKIEELVAKAKVKHGNIPVLNADECLEAGIGVCRHIDLVFAFLVSELKRAGILAPGNLFFQRDKHLAGDYIIPHAFFLYRRETVFFDAVLIDPSMGIKSLRLIQDRRIFPDLYSTLDMRKNSLLRCGLGGEQYFRLDLADRARYLYKEYGDRLRFLNYEYASGHLDALQEEIITNNSHNAQTKDILEAIKLIRTSDTLLATKFNKIDNSDSKDQFIFALLLQGSAKRNILLLNQSKDDLIAIQRELKNFAVFFSKYANYNALLDAVSNGIEAGAKETSALFRIPTEGEAVTSAQMVTLSPG